MPPEVPPDLGCEPPVPDALGEDAEPEPLELALVVGTSVFSYTMRTPYAFRPIPGVYATETVDVTPLLLDSVMSRDVDFEQYQVQKNVPQKEFVCSRPRKSPHDMLMSLRTGQQFTVVIVETPAVSWQAVE